MITSATAARTLGSFPLSIGTSIALESVFGIKSEVFQQPQKKVIQNYSEFWFNLKTLFRNLYGSVERNKLSELTHQEMSDALYHEMEIIVDLVNQYSFGGTKVIFYVSNYKDLASRYRLAQIRTDTTPQQLRLAEMQNRTLKEILKYGNVPGSETKVFDLQLKAGGIAKTLILTHIAYDLVSYSNFGALTLIESHTGALKERDKWHTKYNNGKELSFIPFCEGLLPVFGDSELFRPLNKDSREAIIGVAQKYRWSSVTTVDKIRYGINTLQNQYLKDVVLSFLE